MHSFGGDKIAGRTPGVDLSPAGLEQAARLSARLQNLRIDAIYASPLERTQQTARAIATAKGLQVQTAEELNELDFGAWTGAELEDLKKEARWKRFNQFRSGTRASEGELMLEAQLRIVRLMQRLAEAHKGQTLALVSHGDVIRAAVCHYLGVPLDHFLRFEISPASISLVAIADYGPWIGCLNSTESLPQLAK